MTFDCSDGELLARFWSGVTGWPWSKQEMAGNPFRLVGQPEDDRDRLVFVEVPEAKAAKNRSHLDLLVRDGPEGDEVVRLQALGAKVIDDRRDATPGGWVVMADPEGNEFCLEGVGWQERERRERSHRPRGSASSQQLHAEPTFVCWTGSMHETPEELDRLQALLDASAAAAGTHLRSIVTEERRLDSSQGQLSIVVDEVPRA